MGMVRLVEYGVTGSMYEEYIFRFCKILMDFVLVRCFYYGYRSRWL